MKRRSTTAEAATADPIATAPGAEPDAAQALLLPNEPAPIRLMNTIWAARTRRYDGLTTPGELAAWLTAVKQPEESVVPDAADLQRFRALRDALRRLAADLTGDTRPYAQSTDLDLDEAVAIVNRAAAEAPTWSQLVRRDGNLGLAPVGSASVTQRLLASIAHEAIALVTGPDRDKLQSCYAPNCLFYFLKDQPRREWCSPVCGNRVRAARHYLRHHRNQPAD
ncbi:CGNR zinc finger domain-containing protein [Micromonospora sp. NPDC023737]|uniref:CGNR zinc finger domain-containing protein n=1 Tax=unclassified Micromonospora TaxID=2617518 RepID=UPI0033CD7738